MRIKLAILEKDQRYLERIVSVFSTKYADKFEIYSFTDVAMAMSTLDSARIDVFVASDAFDIDVTAIPKRCGFTYFADSADIDIIRDQRAICKFQKADLIYKQILGIYSEKAGSTSGLKLGDESAKILAFCSAGGGTGSSSMAASAAIYFAGKGQRVLYLNLEKFGSSDDFFTAEGQFDMSDIIFALKSQKTNLPLKLESCVKQDRHGVYFYSRPKVALDMYELTANDTIRLIEETALSGHYDEVILDMDFSLDSDFLRIFRQVHALVWVGDGSEISNGKVQRAYQALSIAEQGNDSPLMNRLCFIYNKFSNKTSRTIEGINFRNVGGAPRYEHASTEQVLEQLSKMEMFDKIL
ncbi:MAG TPA: chromosome partitioning protein ParA [Candidatus Onthovicinus excrementipullorum]|nr:chromosome partitioning protein ParA [Candidatus Onthovicinus excrementipullorum]